MLVASDQTTRSQIDSHPTVTHVFGPELAMYPDSCEAVLEVQDHLKGIWNFQVRRFPKMPTDLMQGTRVFLS